MKRKLQGSLFTGYTLSLVEFNSEMESTQSSLWLKLCYGRNLLPWSLPHSFQGLPKTVKQSHLVNTLPSHTCFSLSPCTLHFGTWHPLDLSVWKTWLCFKLSLWWVALNRKDAGSSSPRSADSHCCLASLIIPKDSFIMGPYNSTPFDTQVKSSSYFIVSSINCATNTVRWTKT